MKPLSYCTISAIGDSFEESQGKGLDNSGSYLSQKRMVFRQHSINVHRRHAALGYANCAYTCDITRIRVYYSLGVELNRKYAQISVIVLSHLECWTREPDVSYYDEARWVYRRNVYTL